MHKKTLEELAFYQIRDEAAAFCVSEEGQFSFHHREPLTDSAEIETLKAYSREWTTILHGTKSAPLSSWNPIFSFLKLAQADGATLEQEQCYSLLLFCQSAKKVSDIVQTAALSMEVNRLYALTKELPLSELTQADFKISRVLDKNGQLKDLPELRAIRTKIASLHSDIAAALKKYTSDTTLSSVLESTVPAYRADRQVLAVKASQRNRIQGIVHEVSQTGQTLYIEPEEVVRKNNELVQEEYHLQAEIRKVFTDLTADIRELIPAFSSALKTMSLLDTTLAAARWGIEKHAVYALPCTEQPPLLLQSRHPLLREKAVPIDIRFLEGKRVLIITGPNTGGKTVTLKTFALLCMLNQAGLPVPAAEGTRLPLFNAIFADIGDEQSIDQSLSTFSAHMKNIAAAVKHADNHSLVLLDELGSGTDPQEGSAIAMAVLDTLIERKAFILVTTHHGILKNYGYTNPLCVNASVDFDTNTLAPTYRLQMGVPGESHALDIAKRSGLPHAIVDKAKSYLTNEQADVSSLIKGLTKKHAELAELEKDAALQQQILTDRTFKIEQRELKLRQKDADLKKREHSDESAFLRETRKRLENLVRELREGEITREKTLATKQFMATLADDISAHEQMLSEEEAQLERDRATLEAQIEKEKAVRAENGMLISKAGGKHSSNKKTKRRMSNAEALASAKPSSFAGTPAEQGNEKTTHARHDENLLIDAKPTFAEGAEVLVNSSKMCGTLIREEKKGVWLVQIGSLRMSLKKKDLTLVASAPETKPAISYSVELSSERDEENAIFMKGGATAKPVFELRLLGMREEEAIKLLERQLDLCSMQNFRTFSVIHGKGEGILQQAVQDYLSSYPGVKEFHFARPEDGGTGKTYVTLE
ncbi:MAG: Smr/MutS family protein [Treponema sp.]|nr:Smr/MutS family protein [Treponema sp.]